MLSVQRVLEGSSFVDVLVETGQAKGSATQRCLLIELGPSPPRGAGLPEGIVDDTPVQTAATLETAQVRLTVARDYAADDLFTRAAQRPASLADLIFNAELQKMVLKVKGALNYESELTCLFIMKKSPLEKFMQFPLPRGVFVNLQGSKLVPRRFKQRDAKTAEAYLERVTVSSTAGFGRLCYRPPDDAGLGALTDQPLTTDIIP
eukprot:3025397-Pyramimonas_sp.AAC.1